MFPQSQGWDSSQAWNSTALSSSVKVTFQLSTMATWHQSKTDHNSYPPKNFTTCEDGANRPGWVPSVRVVIRDGKAQSGVCLKPFEQDRRCWCDWEQRKIMHIARLPAIWGGHVYWGWLEGELWRQKQLQNLKITENSCYFTWRKDQLAMIHPILV